MLLDPAINFPSFVLGGKVSFWEFLCFLGCLGGQLAWDAVLEEQGVTFYYYLLFCNEIPPIPKSYYLSKEWLI